MTTARHLEDRIEFLMSNWGIDANQLLDRPTPEIVLVLAPYNSPTPPEELQTYLEAAAGIHRRYGGTHNAEFFGMLHQRLGDLRRDRGLLEGTDGAEQAYRNSLRFYTDGLALHRLPAVCLGLGATFEMRDDFQRAAAIYSSGYLHCPRRTEFALVRSALQLRLGTVLTKLVERDLAPVPVLEHAERLIVGARTTATTMGDEGASDFASQKLVLLKLAGNDLDGAVREWEAVTAQTIQRAALKIVQAQIAEARLKSATGNHDEAAAILVGAKAVAGQYGFGHQLRSISAILADIDSRRAQT